MEKIQIRRAQKQDIERLIWIWSACFGDEARYSRTFFESCEWEDEDTLIYAAEINRSVQYREPEVWALYKDGTVVSMLSSLPAWLFLNGKKREVSYFYAVATDPKHQGYGYGSKLLLDVVQREKKKGRTVLLVPASESLQKFYEVRGFIPAAWMNEFVISNDRIISEKRKKEWVKWNIENVDSTSYKAARDRAFFRDGYLEWDQKAIAYRMKEANLTGSFFKKIIVQENMVLPQTYVMYGQKQRADLILRETTMPIELLEKMGMQLAVHYGCERLVVQVPSFVQKGKKKLIAMSTEKMSGEMYWNLLLNDDSGSLME